VGVNVHGLVQSFYFDFDFLRGILGALKRFRETGQYVADGFLHHVVEGQLLAVYPELGLKILFDDSVTFTQNNQPHLGFGELS
jgi:hypothetical protein